MPNLHIPKRLDDAIAEPLRPIKLTWSNPSPGFVRYYFLKTTASQNVILKSFSLQTLDQVYREAAVHTVLEKRWSDYLRSLETQKTTTESASVGAQRIWRRLKQTNPSATPPNAELTEEHGLVMSWLVAGKYLEIEITPAGPYEWLYRDDADESSGENVPPEVVPPKLAAHFTHLFENPA